MRRAYIDLRPRPVRRVEVFHQGLRACGYEVHDGSPKDYRPDDVLVIWNRRGHGHAIAQRVEKAGGTVLVAENAYIKREGYALARSRHNGGGVPLVNDPERGRQLGVELKPWREDGRHILVAPNRWIGPPGEVMPANWVSEVVAGLKRFTGRPVKVRPHPGNWKRNPPAVPIEEDLRGAWACVIWWSTAGLRALFAGVPVIYLAGYWIGQRGAGRELASVKAPAMPERAGVLEDVGNGQFSLQEIADGLPFRGLTACEELA